jgi:two-component system LytT family response regulator
MFKTVIIDDDPFSQETLKDILGSFSDGYEIVAVYSGVEETLNNLPQQDVDLVLLDMELQDGQGFDVLRQIEDINFEIIITTMHDSFMLEAIKHSAIDYLMKPISKVDLSAALSRFEKKIEKFELLKKSKSVSRKNRLVIPDQKGLILLEIKDIIRLESDGAYTKLFVANGETHLISKNLGYYENKLGEHDFTRVHHKHLINMNHVKNYLRGEGGTLIMSDNSSIEVSRRKKDFFLQKLGMR